MEDFSAVLPSFLRYALPAPRQFLLYTRHRDRAYFLLFPRVLNLSCTTRKFFFLSEFPSRLIRQAVQCVQVAYRVPVACQHCNTLCRKTKEFLQESGRAI